MTIKILLQELVDVLGLDQAEDLEVQINKTYSDVDVSVTADTVVITIDDIYTLNNEVYKHLVKLCDKVNLTEL